MRSAERHTSSRLPTVQLTARQQKVLLHLLEAYDYSVEFGRDVWDFAVPLPDLRTDGVRSAELRFLICAGYALHAVVTRDAGAAGQVPQPPINLTFTDDSCFVLTKEGAEIGRALSSHDGDGDLDGETDAPGGPDGLAVPFWDPDLLELHYRGRLVKKFRQPSPDQETILNSFQELGWVRRIDNPLPPRSGQTEQQRLHGTVRRLNLHQQNRLIHFCSDGHGQGVCWRPAGRHGSDTGATRERHGSGS
jgi:hypothetical protein